jgi:hypothetical protein
MNQSKNNQFPNNPNMTPSTTQNTGSPRSGRNTSFARIGGLTVRKLVGMLFVMMSVIRIWHGLHLWTYYNDDNTLSFDMVTTHHAPPPPTTTKLLESNNNKYNNNKTPTTKTTTTTTRSDSVISDEEYCQTKLRLRNTHVNKTHLDWSDPIFKRKGWDDDPIVIEAHKVRFFYIACLWTNLVLYDVCKFTSCLPWLLV